LSPFSPLISAICSGVRLSIFKEKLLITFEMLTGIEISSNLISKFKLSELVQLVSFSAETIFL
jgi:hypothetical protein